MKERIGRQLHLISFIPITILVSLLILKFFGFILDLEAEPVILYPFFWIILAGYYLAPNIGILYLMVWAIAINESWKIKVKSFKKKIFLIVYSVSLLICVFYVVWWYVTLQEFQSL
ncbi:MAG: hypothetical protein JXR20_01895 [Balneola sp.]